MKKAFLIVMLTSLLLTACCPAFPAEPKPVFVTAVAITRRDGKALEKWEFHREEKIREVLEYLRRLNIGTPLEEDTAAWEDQEFTILLTRSDGSEKQYRQYGDLYFKTGDGPWKRIFSRHPRTLNQILASADGEGHTVVQRFKGKT